MILEHIQLPVVRRRPIYVNILLAARPLHWIKNIFVFSALAFSLKLFHSDAVWVSALVFLAFCMVSSAVYMINDVTDREEDARHPSKRTRPITSGQLSTKQALVASSIFCTAGILLSWVVNEWVVMLVSGYVVMNVFYSFTLKKILILDVIIIAMGFVLRVLAGGFALNYELSNWILICTFFLSTLIGFAKRRYEITSDGLSFHEYKGYTPYLLDLLITATAASVISSYAFYVMLRGNWQNGLALLASIAVVFFGVIRYVLIIYRSEEQLDHTKLILTDKPLVASVLIWISLLITEIYVINPHLQFIR
ncbi:UbiA prenyltransferase family protein [bacterium]|nr:UbiA prenyltransferase family protein [bacterium]